MPSLILLPNDNKPAPFEGLPGSSYEWVYFEKSHRLYALRETALQARW
jgi:hypothetical protein